MRTFMAAAMMAGMTSALLAQNPWTIDLRGTDDETVLLVVQGGESFDVIVEGMPTTGYSWQNDLQFSHGKNVYEDDQAVFFLGESELEESEPEYGTMDMPGIIGGEGKFIPSTKIGGRQKQYVHQFTTAPDIYTFKEIKFGYFRSWEAGNEFPDPSDTADFCTLELVVVDEFKHDIELGNIDAFEDVMPDSLDVEEGDWVRLRLSENPSTGYRWMTNADTEDNQDTH